MDFEGTTGLEPLIDTEPLILDPADLTHSMEEMSPDYPNFDFPRGREFEIPPQLEYSNTSHSSATRDSDMSMFSPSSSTNTTVNTTPVASRAPFMSPPPPPPPPPPPLPSRVSTFRPRASLPTLLLTSPPTRGVNAMAIAATAPTTTIITASNEPPIVQPVVPRSPQERASSVTVLGIDKDVVATFTMSAGRPTNTDLREIILTICNIDIYNRSPMLKAAVKCDVVWDCICTLGTDKVTIDAHELSTKLAGRIRLFANQHSAKVTRERVKENVAKERAMLVSTIDQLTDENKALQAQLKEARRQILELQNQHPK